NYVDPNFNVGSSFLGGEYSGLNIFDVALDRDELNHFLRAYLADSLYRFSSVADLDDYETEEEVLAGYIMTEINFGRLLMFLPGVRYERTHAKMTGRKGVIPKEFDEPSLENPLVTDTTATNKYGRWFPMFQMRFRPTNWFDIRLAYTKTISRPQLSWMLPKRKVHGNEFRVEFGRPDLKPQISTNYDAFLSIYGNKIGLFTLGGFYKKVDDLIFKREGHLILDPEAEGLPLNLKGMTLDRPENSPFKTEIKGFEIEWQTNFHWLPRPFDGIVLNANYAHIWSETRFPRSFVRSEPAPPPIFRKKTVVDSSRVGNMPDQADNIANLAIGYDKGPFSARFSMLYQGKTLTIVGERPEYDGFTADLLRWDVSIKYRLTSQIGLFVSLNNVTDEPDESFQQATRFPTQREFYGWTADFGVGYQF
ncbi:MAG: TonB-dependent receptor domain-containing protein, partial [bacterium]